MKHLVSLELLKKPRIRKWKNIIHRLLEAYIDKGIELEILNPELKTFDLEKLGSAIDYTRDNQFTYLGLQTLYDRYFIHCDDVRYELPQVFFMRVAMGLAVEEENREERAIEFYKLLSSFRLYELHTHII